MAGEYPASWERHGPKRRIARFAGLLGLIVLTLASWNVLDVRYDYVATAPAEMRNILGRMYPPDVAYTGEILLPLLNTINIAVIGTLFAVVMALPIAYIGAENTTPNRLTYALGKFLIVATRSVHVIIWALIFVVVFGTGTLAGIFAVAFRSIGFLAKLLAEEIEEIDRTTVEAITATGANGIDVLLYSVVPQIKPAFVGFVTYRWDINVREATIIGFVGAGGIGVELSTRIDFFDWNGVLTILIAILAIVIASEMISAYLRAKVR
ncbi:MAG: phosphonate ABC transporter, permease protein PhnE [Halalkalicoccus sp.]